MAKKETRDQCNPLVMAYLRKRVMPAIADRFRTMEVESPSKSVEEFSDAVEILIAAAITDLRLLVGKSTDFFSPRVKKTIYSWIVGELNAVLPVDHPFIIAILFVEYDGNPRFMGLARDLLPDEYKITKSWQVPFVWSEGAEDLAAGRFRITSIRSPDGETIFSQKNSR